MSTVTELRAKRAKLVEDARALGAKPKLSREDVNKFDAMMAEADELKVEIDKEEAAAARFAARMERERSGIRDPHDHGDPSRVALEESTFNAWVRHGARSLNDEQRSVYNARFQAALGVGDDTAGGYTVPQGMYSSIIDAEKAYGGMQAAAFVFETATGNDLPIPTSNDTTNVGSIIGENTPVGEQDVSFGTATMHAYTYTSKVVLVSNQLLQDSAFPIDAWLAEKLGTRIGRAVNIDCTVGNGSARPSGIVGTAPGGATLGRTAGGSSTSGSTASIGVDDLISLEHSVDPAYRRKAVYMLSDAALKTIKLLKDGMGRPLWLPGLASAAPDTINGFPYVINQDMPAPTPSAKSVAFGDFSKYFIRQVVGVRVLRLVERYADSNQVGFLAFQRWDGMLIDAGTHPIAYLQQSAS